MQNYTISILLYIKKNIKSTKCDKFIILIFSLKILNNQKKQDHFPFKLMNNNAILRKLSVKQQNKKKKIKNIGQ